MPSSKRRRTRSLSSPKRRGDNISSNSSNGLNYYAAFSHAFVSDLVGELKTISNGLLLDPWNGRGTTTLVAAQKGINAIGFDLNPAMVALADGRLVRKELARKAQRRFSKIRISDALTQTRISKDDGLLSWLAPSSVAIFRGLQGKIEAIVSDTTARIPDQRTRYVQTRRLRAFLNASLCSALRTVLASIETSNPTWIPQSIPKSQRLRPSPKAIAALARAFLTNTLDGLPSVTLSHLQSVTVSRADSRALPLPTSSVATVISSPPYCTRIDYAIATSPELYLLCSLSSVSFRDLRDRLIGTTSINLRQTHNPPREWGRQCVSVLRQISQHRSKASDTYYLKNLLQYFGGLWDSLREIDRVMCARGTVALVVQDSYYKEILIDLPAIVAQMGANLGWIQKDKHDFRVSSTLAATNPGTRQYRDTFEATESLLIFRTASRSA